MRYGSRELAYCGVFGAAAMLLPVLFHLVSLGSLFMPMYLPLLALAFLVRPVPALITALVVPLLSGMTTGMPPFFPPIAPVMAVELALMTGGIAVVVRRWTEASPWLVLPVALLVGRVWFVGAFYVLAQWMALPAGFLAGLSFLAGWPGLILIMATIPPFVQGLRRSGRLIAAPAHLEVP